MRRSSHDSTRAGQCHRSACADDVAGWLPLALGRRSSAPPGVPYHAFVWPSNWLQAVRHSERRGRHSQLEHQRELQLAELLAFEWSQHWRVRRSNGERELDECATWDDEEWDHRCLQQWRFGTGGSLRDASRQPRTELHAHIHLSHIPTLLHVGGDLELRHRNTQLDCQ